MNMYICSIDVYMYTCIYVNMYIRFVFTHTHRHSHTQCLRMNVLCLLFFRGVLVVDEGCNAVHFACLSVFINGMPCHSAGNTAHTRKHLTQVYNVSD